MKLSKSRILAIAAFVAAGAAAHAQLVVNGYYRPGFAYYAPGEDNESATSSTMADKTVGFMDRIRLNLSFAAPDDMYGFKARMQADSSGTTSGLMNLFAGKSTAKTTAKGTGTPAAATYTTTVTTSAPSTLKYAQGYVKFLDGMLKLSAGKLDVTDYMAAQSIGNVYLGLVATDAPVLKGSLLGTQSGNTTGAILQAWPVENLSVALAMRADGTEMKTHHWGVDAYYIVPGIGKALFASQIGSYAPVDEAAEGKLDKSFASLGFSYTGFAGLTATASYRYNGRVANDDGEYEPSHGAIAIVEYSSGPLFADLSGDFDFSNGHSYVEGELSYAIVPAVKLRAYFGATDDLDRNPNVKLNGIANKTLYGADIVLPVGKAEVSAGFAYGDEAKLQMPVLAKINF
jgi:hypothetical protein